MRTLFFTFTFDLFLGTALAFSPSYSGECGSAVGLTCSGSDFGPCCSQHGYCGFSTLYCGFGCQPAFGSCGSSAPVLREVSPDGTCGGSNGYTCAGSEWGECCSQYGYCGSTSEYCDNECKDDLCHRCVAVGQPCTIDNSTACCSQCCYFAKGDMLDGRCCDM